jgi:hypothetical protein
MQSGCRPAGERQRPAKQLLSFGTVPLSEAHLGEPLQAVRLAGGGSDVMVQLGGLGQLGIGKSEVTGEQRGLAAQGGGEGDRPQHT